MSRIKTFIKSSMIYGFGNSLNLTLAFFLIPIYIQNLTISEYGKYGLLMIIVQTISRFANLGLESAMMRSFYDYSELNQGKVYTTTLLMMGSILGVILIIGYFFGNWIGTLLFSSSSVELLFIYSAFGIGALRAIRKIPQTILRIEEKPKLYVGIEIFNFLLGFGLIFYLLAFRNLGLYGLLLGTLLSSSINVSILFLATIRFFKPGILVNEIKKQFKFAIPLVPSAGSALVLLGSGRYFLEKFHNLEMVGVFTLATQIGGISETFIGQALKLSWRPFFFKNYKNSNISARFEKLFNNVAVISSFINIGISFSILPFINLFEKSEYLNSSIFIPIILFYQTFWSITPIYNGGIAAARKTSFVLYNFILGGSISIILNLLLTPKFGIYGASFTMLFTYLIMFVVIQLYNVKLGYNYVVWKKHWVIYGIAGIYILLSALLKGSGTVDFFLRISIILSYPLVIYIFSRWIDYDLITYKWKKNLLK